MIEGRSTINIHLQKKYKSNYFYFIKLKYFYHFNQIRYIVLLLEEGFKSITFLQTICESDLNKLRTISASD
jgi:hypothetical protein